jgi:hypothetical protein
MANAPIANAPTATAPIAAAIIAPPRMPRLCDLCPSFTDPRSRATEFTSCSRFCALAELPVSNALVHQGNKGGGAHEEVAPFRVVARARFGGDNLGQRFTLLFECRDFVANFNQHISE